MKKKLVALVASFSVLSICAAAVGVSLAKKADSVKGTLPLQSMTLDSTSDVYEIDSGVAHQVNIKNNKFDIVGYQAVASKFGSIKKATYGSYDYNGMIYNRSVINGFEYLTVNFTGGNLYYTFTDFLMEDMSFDQSNQLTSGTSVAAGGKAYFVVYNPSTTPVEIESLTVEYYCDSSIDAEMIFNKDSTTGGARSLAKVREYEDSFVKLTNNPYKYYNNYSRGHNVSEVHDNSWYRWNGIFFKQSDNYDVDFTFGMTIIGDYSRMIDESKFFHYGVWPQFNYVGSTGDDAKYGSYVMTYIGNDNYEPYGKDNALFPDDPYVKQSYTGRFFSYYDDYGYDPDNPDKPWEFCNPDIETVADGVTTFRQAYEQYNLPFWFVKFHVYIDTDISVDSPVCTTYINGIEMFTDELFYSYDMVNQPKIYLQTLPLHVVNYGIDAAGNRGENIDGVPYYGTFTYPRVID